jgi:hypothetical protein
MKTKITLGILAFSLILYSDQCLPERNGVFRTSARLAEEEAIVEGYLHRSPF